MVKTKYVMAVSWVDGSITHDSSYDYGRLADRRERIERNPKVRDTSINREFVGNY